METRQVRAGRDTILGYVDRASPVDILAELIWNALDAEAMNVETTVTLGAMGAPEEIVVRDDGHGMPHRQIPDLFLTHGESWKRTTGFSPNINRPMHGRLGRGRFLVYGIAERVEWRSVSADGGALTETVVHGKRAAPNEFSFDGPWPATGPTGTTVRMAARQISRVAAIGDGDVHLPLTARLAATLLGLREVKVTFRQQALDPRAHIIRDTDLDVEVDAVALCGKPRPRLRVVEWSADMGSKTLYLCDERGGVVTEYKPPRTPSVPLHWTAYLQWEGFRDPDLMSQADLHAPDIRHGELLAAVQYALARYLRQRMDEQRGGIVAEWKAQGVYPYQGEPATIAEQVEREVFDIVAVVASRAISRQAKQKKLSLRLLLEVTRAEPSRANHILNAVLDLTKDEQEVLRDLLERTKLASIVHASLTIADRSGFVRGLRGLLYANENRTVFREVDQLHQMLVAGPWIFGDEWSSALPESGLSPVVRMVLTKRDDVEFAPGPVVLPSATRGRVDMMFYRHVPENRHLVVALKRPKPLTMVDFDQVDNYAAAITGHPEVAATPSEWDFWLVGTELDRAVRDLRSDPARPGLAANNPHCRIWVMTWGQLLDHAEHRIQALRDAVELMSTDQVSRDYLRRKHTEFISPPDHGKASE